jgi:tryptophan 2,3-dioxygenase
VSDRQPSVTYSSYLALDEVLSAQRPLSDEHDEMLFIVVHQVYELWFKQMLHELAHLRLRLREGDSPHVLHTLKRILSILKVAVAQIDVLETMTPRQFTGFRSRLEAASGFQSAQFRLLEVALGRRDSGAFGHHPEGGDAHRRIAAAMTQPSVFDSYLTYLSRNGYRIPDSLAARDVREPWEPSTDLQDVLLGVYRDDGEPAQVAERLVDLDEGMQEWRYRHVKMVERTIGDKGGTGGSTGAAYLRATLSHPVFPDLWAVRSRL